MSAQYNYVEQDSAPPPGGDDLPTYDDLAAQNGPNSRFGRWRGWIEKRAAERYADTSPEERARRRARGWDLNGGSPDSEVDEQLASSAQDSLSIHNRQLPALPPRPAVYPQQPPLASLPPQPHLYQQNVSPIYLPPDSYNGQAPYNGQVPPPGLNIPGPMNNLNLHVQTNNLTFQLPPSPPARPETIALPFISQKLPPTHLKLNNFGSRFLPHTTSPIRCLLPLPSERLLLIGHDEGLSVLDMFPQEWTETGQIAVKGPDEAQTKLIWKGEGVYQMSILEVEDTGEGTPQGVVLALVGPDPSSPSGKDQETIRTLRMYNLSSLISLAKWAVSHKGAKALDLHRPSNWQVQQTPSKRHRPQSSLARGLRSLIDSPSHGHSSQFEPSSSSYQRLLTSTSSLLSVDRGPTSGRSSPINGSTSNLNGRGDTPVAPKRVDSVDSSWELVDDLPLRWATDFVPLASPGSRLVGTSVISYALWSEEKLDKRSGSGKKGGRMLAVATKANIFIYETPRGERAFHFVKEFYTPLSPRSLTFFKQSIQDVPKTPSELGSASRYAGHSRSESGGIWVRERRVSSSSVTAPSNSTLSYDAQLSLFVIFDKKAGWIRLADSAVGEVELADDGCHTSPPSHHLSLPSRDSLSPIRRSRISMDFGNYSSGKWILPVKCDLPLPTAQPHHTPTQGVYILTKGKQSRIMPCPLPANISSCPPLKIVSWKNPPNHVAPRVCNPAVMGLDMDDVPPYLQLVSMCEDGIEVQEIPLSFLNVGKGKGKTPAPANDAVWTEEDVGGSTGFLCTGGHWDAYNELNDFGGLSGFGSGPGFGPRFQAHLAGGLNRTLSTASDVSDVSFDSLRTEDISMRLKQEEGIYGWCRRGLEDYRVFWVGGSLVQDLDDDDV